MCHSSAEPLPEAMAKAGAGGGWAPPMMWFKGFGKGKGFGRRRGASEPCRNWIQELLLVYT